MICMMMNPNEESTPSTSSSSVQSNGFGSGSTNGVLFPKVVQVMKLHPGTRKVKTEAVELLSHATELFIKDLLETCYQLSPEALTYDLLAMVIAQSGNKSIKEAAPETITYREYLRLKKKREAQKKKQEEAKKKEEEEAKKKDDFFDEKQQQQQEGEKHGNAADVDGEEKVEDKKDKDNDNEAEDDDVIFIEERRREDKEHGYAADFVKKKAKNKKDKKIDKKDEKKPIYYDHFVESKDDQDENNDSEELGEIWEESIVADEEAGQLFH